MNDISVSPNPALLALTGMANVSSQMMNFAMPVSLSPYSLPQAGERDEDSLREIHVKEVTYHHHALGEEISIRLAADYVFVFRR